MKLTKLRDLFESARHNPNYHYRELSDETYQEMATASFNKLTESQSKRVVSSWKDSVTDKINLEEWDVAKHTSELVKFRFMAQTNLFFMCHLLETYKQTTVNTHEEICNKFFVQKNPTFSTFEKFANQYTDLKDRMLLVPRGGFKSSIDIADCVQWIACFPAVTILILTGVYKLASDFVGELRGHFTLENTEDINEETKKVKLRPKLFFDDETGVWSSSMFQVMFPEHTIPPGEGTQFEYESPAGGHEKEPTVRAASIEQALAGMHFAVMKLDDVVTNENSQTVDRLVKVNKQISIDRAMLHPYGFMDVIGTWYDEKDYYGLKIKQQETFAKDEGLLDCVKGTVDSGRFEISVDTKIYLRSALWLTEAAVEAGKTDLDAKAQDYELWFPERLDFKFLSTERKTDPEGFAIKYLNNPRKIHRIKFDRALLIKRTIPHNQLPPQGVVVTTIDTAYSTKSWADYTVILTTLIYGGRFYVINMVRGRFSEYELPAVIAATGHKWKPKRIAIEDSVGVKWMGRELRREMDKLQISIPVEYVSLGLGNKSKSKQLKAKPVLRLLGDERMYFLNSCEGLNELYNELEAFTGTNDDAHDDIVSALSLLVEQFSSYADAGARVTPMDAQYVSDKQNYERHQLIYGLGKYAKFNANQMINDDNPVTTYQLENDNRFREPQGPADVDPLADLYV